MIEDLESVDGELKEFYTQGDDGKYRLAVEDPESLVDTEGLKSALGKERQRSREMAARLKALEQIDPAEFSRLKKESEQRAQNDLAKAGRWDLLKARLEQEHQGALAEQEKTIARLRADLGRQLMDSAASTALSRAGGMPALLLPHVKARLQMMESEHGPQLRVIDQDGNERLHDGAPMTLEDLVAEMRSDPLFAPAFSGNGGSGGGSPAGAGSAGQARPGDLLARSQEALKKGDVALSLKLKNEYFARRQAGQE
jgi:hypothetical protein